MAQQNIDFGSFPDDPSADAIRTAFTKVQTNFDQLFNANANSAVTSINRTPGAGITVNYPTGNVIVSANIACLQVSTSSLKVGRGSDNTQSNVTITSSSQTLNIDIDPDQVFSNYYANVGNGLALFNGTLTSNSNSQPNITAIGTLVNLSVSGNATLGNIYSDNIYYANGDPAITPAAGANTQIQYADNSNAFAASANLTFNDATQVLTVAGSANVIKLNANGNINFTGANAYFSNVSNVKIPGGTLGYYLQTDGAGNLSWAAGGGGGGGSPGGVDTSVQFNDTGLFGANTGFTFNKTTGIFTAPFLAGNGNGLSNIQGANVSGFVPNANVANTALAVDGANVSGFVANANVANTTLAVAGANVSGFVPNANVANTAFAVAGGNVSGQVANALIAGTVYINAQPNITSLGNLVDLTVDGNLSIGNNATITGNLTVLGNATYYNVETLVVQDPLIDLGGGPNGVPPVSNSGYDLGLTMQYYNTAAKIAYMGFDNSNAEFAFGNDVTVASEIITFNSYGNVRALNFLGSIAGPTGNFSGNLTSANANLGNTASANFFIGRFYGTANAATVANTVVDNAQPNITSVGTLTSLGVTGTTTSGNFVGTLANGNSNIRIATDSNIGISAIGNANVVVITGTGVNVSGTGNFTGNLSAQALYGPLANGNSNISIPIANNSVTISSAGNANIVVVSGTGANITGTLGTTGNASVLGIKTDNYYYANGNPVSFAGTYGNSNVATFLASYGSNTLTTTGNVSVGNIIGNGQALTGLPGANVSGAVAYATTANAVAGANVTGTVSSATTAGTVTTAAQPNITSVGTLTSLSSSGNITGANLITTGFHIRSVGTGISANGISQATATALTKEFNIVSTVSAGQGVVLPTAVAGMAITITNSSATNLAVYPASGAAINSLSANAALTHGAGATLQYIAPTTTQWYTVGATYA